MRRDVLLAQDVGPLQVVERVVEIAGARSESAKPSSDSKAERSLGRSFSRLRIGEPAGAPGCGTPRRDAREPRIRVQPEIVEAVEQRVDRDGRLEDREA